MCGNISPDPIESTQSFAHLVFKSDSTNARTGFRLLVEDPGNNSFLHDNGSRKDYIELFTMKYFSRIFSWRKNMFFFLTVCNFAVIPEYSCPSSSWLNELSMKKCTFPMAHGELCMASLQHPMAMTFDNCRSRWPSLHIFTTDCSLGIQLICYWYSVQLIFSSTSRMNWLLHFRCRIYISWETILFRWPYRDILISRSCQGGLQN